MGHRLTRIVTRTGDDGSTGLGDGTRTGKDSLRITAIGEVDELNAALGLLLAESLPADLHGPMQAVQHDLFELGGELSIPGYEGLRATRLARLDALLDSWNATLPPLQEFILPGGARSAAAAHQARTVCRRAERAVVALDRQEALRPLCRQYLNRLSDLLFVLARMLNRDAGRGDVLWQRDRSAAE